MKTFFRLYYINITCLVALIIFSRCTYVGILIMSVDNKTTVDKFKSGKYKTHIQTYIGLAGPFHYHCRVKEKKLGGLYYHKIVSKTFSWDEYKACVLKYPGHHSDTIVVNVCEKKTVCINY